MLECYILTELQGRTCRYLCMEVFTGIHIETKKASLIEHGVFIFHA
jgi:hypothetical protein